MIVVKDLNDSHDEDAMLVKMPDIDIINEDRQDKI